MVKHLLKEHLKSDGEATKGRLIIVSSFAKRYYFAVDVKADAKLSVLDDFMRDIWLDCCGHMSAFSLNGSELPMTMKISALPLGVAVMHKYDFGSTTTCQVTAISDITFPE